MLTGLKKWWDSICLGCGQCCCDKVRLGTINIKKKRFTGTLTVNKNYVVDYSSPCCYLDIETGRCLVYGERFQVSKTCIPMTIFHALFADYLPENCAYVRKFRFWRRF